MSINSLYELSRRSLQAQTAQMGVAGQNVANLDTPGYARRRLTMEATPAVGRGVFMRPASPAGAGMNAGTIERMRDTMLAAAAREARSGMAGSGEQARLLGALESVFGAGGRGLTDAMDGFWQGWSDLSDHPTDLGVREALLGRAHAAADALNRMSGDLQRFAGETRIALGESVQQANTLLEEVAALNTQILSARASGAADLSAEDRRDQVLDQLAGFLPIQVHEGPDGLAVSTGGLVLVQGSAVERLRLAAGPTTGTLAVEVGGTGQPLRGTGGTLGGLVHTLNQTLPGTRASLDAFAADLVAGVNALHAGGHGLDGSTGLAFFDPEGTTAASIRVVLPDAASLAAAGAADAPGDNATALAISALRGGMDERATSLVSGLGDRLRTARAESAGHAAALDHLTAMERAVSGVSLDEEMTRLIEAQQAFAASARVLSTVEEMMNTLLRL